MDYVDRSPARTSASELAASSEDGLLVRSLLLAIGWLSVVLGVVGIFLPLLPTTPFILLAAWAFSRSSDRFHHWLISHPYLGSFIRSWQSGGLSKTVRNRVLIVMWMSLSISAMVVAKLWTSVALFSMGLSTTAYLIFKTRGD